jgi:transposase
MANNKTVPVIHSILTLYNQGRKKLRIAEDLGIDVKTVRRYIRLAEAGYQEHGGAESKSLISPTGNGRNDASNSLISPAGNLPHRAGRPSKCEPFRLQIEAGLAAGLDAQRIYQDLRTDHGFAGGYDAVKRFCHKIKQADPQRVYRVESLPGEEAQVDFGEGRWLQINGRRRKVYILRVVLSFSRKGYAEAVSSPSAESFIRCLENAFRHFGGVPQTLNIDNLRAAVKKADWYEPELTPKILSFCRHYNTVVLPCRVRCPEHKGKVENSIKYMQNNALKARTFPSIQALNLYLKNWENTVADCRIHGTTRQQVSTLFERERPALQPLPLDLFACFREGQRTVHRDSHVEVAKAYYEVPAEYIGQKVWVRWDSSLVRVFNLRHEQIAVLARQKPGQFTRPLGVRGRPAGSPERDKAFWLKRCTRLGDHCGLWALEIVARRGTTGIRVLQGMVQLASKHTGRQLDLACEMALSHGAYRLRDLRRLLAQPSQQQSLSFMSSHELIRDMQEYRQFLEILCPDDEPIKEMIR